MRKEEIRNDPVRDKIVQGINFIKENKNFIYWIIGSIAIAITSISYFQNIKNIKHSYASNISGLAQNDFINGDKDKAIVKFQRVLDDYKGSNGALQSSIYLLSDALQNNDTEKLLELISSIINNIDGLEDPFLKSYIFKVKGDILVDQKDLSNAIVNYKLASKYADSVLNKVRFDIATSSALLMDNSYSEAADLLEEVLTIKDINFNDKNKAEELLAIANYKMGT